MQKLPAITGWLWIKEGFSLFRRQPAEMSALFLGYMFLMLAISIIPLLGQILPMLLVPVFSMAFMQACVRIEQGRKVYPNLLLAGFRSPAFGRLVRLGLLYLLAAVLAVAASGLVDNGVFWQVMSGRKELDPQTVRESNMSLAILFSAAVYTPAAMAFWYAAPLIAWQRMGVGKALFYSFFAVKRSTKAFLVYGLAWMLIGILLPIIATSILAMLLGQSALVMIVLLPLSLVLTVAMYCSFYSTYTTVFGRPEAPAAG